MTQWDRDAYNMTTKALYLGFQEFVAIHYALSNRTSTKYWQDICKKEFQPNIAALVPSLQIGFNDLAERRLNINRYNHDSGLHCIATGMNYFPIDEELIKAWGFLDGIDYYESTKKIISNWENLKKIWNKEADESLTMYKYLKKNIHVES